MMRRLFEGALAIALLGLVLAAPARAQDDAVRKAKQEIEALRGKMERAEKDGNWEEYVRLQKRIRELQEQVERMGKGEEGEKDEGSLEEFAARLKARLQQLDEGQRVEALERLADSLRAQGKHDRAEMVQKMLNAMRKGKGGEPGEEAEKKLQELRRELDKAERDFDFEKADQLRAHIRALEEKIEARRREGKGGPEGKDFEARRKALFEELARARDAGDKERVAQIEKEIAEITRGRREGAKDDGRARAQAILDKAMGQLKEWLEGARKEGEEDWARELEQAVEQIRSLRENIERASDPVSREQIGQELVKALQEVRREAAELKGSGQERKAKVVAWAAERLQEVHDCLRPGPGSFEGQAGARKGYRILEEVLGKLRAWAEEAEGAGRGEEAGDIRKTLGDVEKFKAWMQTARGPEMMEQMNRMVEEGLANLEREAAGAKGRGEGGRAERILWMAERLREFRDSFRGGREGPDPEARDRMREKVGRAREEIARLLAESRKLEEQGRADEAMALRKKADAMRAEVEKAMREGGPGGRGEERPELGRKLRELMDELHKAESEEGGDSRRAQGLREKIAELRRQVGEEREGAEPRKEKDEEVARLRKEIDGLRKEMKELRQLLQELLKEPGNEEKGGKKDRKEKNREKKDKGGEEEEQ